MPNFDTNTFPPGGWHYREASLNWAVPNPYLPFNDVVYQIQNVRAQNPTSGLDPSFDTCAADLKLFTEKRVKNARWRVTDEVTGVVPPAEPRRKCGSCGRKKK